MSLLEPTQPALTADSAAGVPGANELSSAHLAALAQVAGGVAPTLSDLLTVIRGQTGRLLEAGASAAADEVALKQIYNAAEKAGSLVRQLMIFSGHQVIQARPLDLNRCIAEHAPALRNLAGPFIAVEFKFAAELPAVLADADLIEQVLLVLVQNAHEAMPQGGTILVQTSAAAAGEFTGLTGDSPNRPAVALEIADSGEGIAPEIRPRLFEPFFTTKTGGRGAGLGLATVYGIVRQHGGRITVESGANGGTRFRVFLPAAPEGAKAVARAGDGSQNPPCTILLVEDDEAVRDFTATFLKEHGFRVLQAAGAVDALEVWQWHRDRIGLLLTDMVLEEDLTGLELAAQLRIDRPDLRVVCTSGFRTDTMRNFPPLGGGYRFVAKPCRPQVLLAAVRELLGLHSSES